MLPFIIDGLTTGAVYALAALGLVLTYKTSTVFNFAHGALATVAAYVFYELHVQHGWAWPIAAVVAVLVVGPIMGLLLELLSRRIQTTSLALRVAATVGLLLAVQAAVVLIYGSGTVRIVPVFLGTGTFSLFGTNVQIAQAVTFGFAVTATAVLAVFLRISRHGVAMRAVVDNPELLDMTGTSPAATRRLGWVIGAVLASASGLLFAPLLSLDPTQLTLLVVSAFGAAAIGAFSSLPLTLLGGLAIGVLASLCTKWFTTGLLSGLSPALPFLVLFVVLLGFPKRRLVGKSFEIPLPRPNWRPPASLQLSGATVLVVVLALVPSFAGIRLTDWTVFVAMAIVFLSLGLLVRTSGQVSLAHMSFTAIGACAFAHLHNDHGVPWFLALLLAGLIAVPIGALLAIPAIRLSGLYLALATFGFGILLQVMFYTQDYMFGSTGAALEMPRPSIASSDKAYYYLVLTIAVVAALLVAAANRTRLGRLLRGASDSTVALETAGASVRVTRVMVFCVSAFLAACGGALAGVAQTTVSADSYQPLVSLTWFALIIVVAVAEPWDAVLASAGLFLIPAYVSGANVSATLQLVFGALAVLYSVFARGLPGVPLPVQRLVDRTFGRMRLHTRGASSAPVALDPVRAERALDVLGVEVRFGGVIAVDGVTMQAPAGRVTGLIGPNGAGKTTTFNACSGLVTPSKGQVHIGGVDVSRRGPAVRARLGIGRTFQKMELFDTLTVRENIEAGAEAAFAGSNPFSHIFGRPGQRNWVKASAQKAIEACELTELATTPAAALSTGQRRLVELARCLSGRFEVLLLDEPSSGLDRVETEHFAEILKRVVAERGVGILLVEHDMSLVLDICQYIYVLDFGELLFQGTPSEVVSSPIVKAAYLGDVEVEQAVPADRIEELA